MWEQNVRSSCTISANFFVEEINHAQEIFFVEKEFIKKIEEETQHAPYKGTKKPSSHPWNSPTQKESKLEAKFNLTKQWATTLESNKMI